MADHAVADGQRDDLTHVGRVYRRQGGQFRTTDTDHAPWIVVKSNDKKRARINAMRHSLAKFDYDGKHHEVVDQPDPLIVGRVNLSD